MTEQAAWIWFSAALEPGGKDGVRLLERFGSPAAVYAAEKEELCAAADLSERVLSHLCDKNTDTALQIEEYCVRHCIGLLSYDNPCYPDRLRHIERPPMLLYYKGKIPYVDQQLCIALVGTRQMSEYGKRMAYRLGYELGGCGAVTVSGMALGIDGMAHQGTLDAGGHTVAVLGCGIDVVYPAAHRELTEQIAAKGTILTEYAPGVRPNSWNFPVRNRIISGLCQGTVVVEASAKSGAILTAEHAIAQGRDIFAVPGNADRTGSDGCHALLRGGAKLAASSRDILDFYAVAYHQYIDPDRVASPGFYTAYADTPRYGSDQKMKKSPEAAKAAAPEKKLPALRAAAGRLFGRGDRRDEGSAGAPLEAEPKETKKEVTYREPDDSVSPLGVRILGVLKGVMTADEIAAECKEEPQTVMPELTVLEIEGLIRSMAGDRFTRVEDDAH